MSRSRALVGFVCLFAAVSLFAREEGRIRRSERRVPDQYIVMLSNEAAGPAGETASALARRYQGRILHIYDTAIRGFAVEMTEAAALRLSGDARVELVEEDSSATLMGAQTGAEIAWALDRIDQRSQPLDGVYTYARTGAGVNAYVIDSGINFSQNGPQGIADLSGRLTHGFTVASNTNGPIYWDHFATINNFKGHGTSVASILAGDLYGVAKGAQVINVRIVQAEGQLTASNAIAGINFAAQHHEEHPGPAVATLCLGIPTTVAVEQAIINAINSGIVFFVPAQQRMYPDYYTMTGGSACSPFPARMGSLGYAQAGVVNPYNRTTVTVGALDSNDRRHLAYSYSSGQWSSNYGPCVDVFAPGHGVKAWTAVGPGGFAGTSAATPYAAGVAALYLEGQTSYDPNTVEDLLKANATSGVLTDVGPGSPNLLIYSRVEEWQ